MEQGSSIPRATPSEKDRLGKLGKAFPEQWLERLLIEVKKIL